MATENIRKNIGFLSKNLTNFQDVIINFLQEEIFEDSELTIIENDWKSTGTALRLFRELMKKQSEAKLSKVIAIFKETGNEHLAEKIEGSHSEFKLVDAEVESNNFFNCEFLEICNCDFIKDGEKIKVTDLSVSLGEAVKVLKIVCDQGTQVDINLNCLSAMECINLRRVRLVMESLIKKMDNVREIDFDLVAFIRQQEEVKNVLINEFVNFQQLKKLSLKGKNMSVDLSGLSIKAELHGTKVICVKNSSS